MNPRPLRLPASPRQASPSKPPSNPHPPAIRLPDYPTTRPPQERLPASPRLAAPSKPSPHHLTNRLPDYPTIPPLPTGSDRLAPTPSPAKTLSPLHLFSLSPLSPLPSPRQSTTGGILETAGPITRPAQNVNHIGKPCHLVASLHKHHYRRQKNVTSNSSSLHSNGLGHRRLL